jgi:chromosome segregation ATPase
MTEETETEETENLVLELLRALRADISSLKEGQRDIKSEIISVRNQIHSMQGDFLRQEKDLAIVRVDVERIKERLNLVEA